MTDTPVPAIAPKLLAQWRTLAEAKRWFVCPTIDGLTYTGEQLVALIDAAEASLSHPAALEQARADERERCAMIVSDRIMAARLGDLDADLRSIAGSIDHDIRALGPWMPTHQHENGTLAREVVRAQFGVGANSIPVVILDDVFHRPFVVAAEKVERDFRPLTEAEARGLLSEMGGRS